MQVELKNRTVGEIFGQCFTLTVDHFAKLLLIALILNLPILIIGLYLEDLMARLAENPDPDLLTMELSLEAGIVLVAMIVQPIQAGASILVVAGSFTGQNLSLEQCITRALKKFFPLLIYSLVTGLIIGLGFMFLIVPGVIFLLCFFVGAPALILENCSWTEAIRRSRELTLHNRLMISLTLTMMFLVVGGAMALVELAHTGLGEIQGILGSATVLIKHLTTTIVAIPGVVLPVAWYFQLRVLKDSMDVAELSSLVDAIAERHEAEDRE